MSSFKTSSGRCLPTASPLRQHPIEESFPLHHIIITHDEEQALSIPPQTPAKNTIPTIVRPSFLNHPGQDAKYNRPNQHRPHLKPATQSRVRIWQCSSSRIRRLIYQRPIPLILKEESLPRDIPIRAFRTDPLGRQLRNRTCSARPAIRARTVPLLCPRLVARVEVRFYVADRQCGV